MSLETATYISQLTPANPAHADGVNAGDAHIRLLKAVLQASFPNVTGAITASLNALNRAGTDGSAAAPAMGYDADATAGFYRSSTGHQTIVGRLLGNGAIDVGAIQIFPRDPGSTVCARGGTATGNERYILLDGSAYPNTKFADLQASGMVTVGSTTFTVDNLCDTGRFIRQYVPGTTSPGSTQANQNLTHNHTITDNGHNHTQNPHNHATTENPHTHALSDNGEVFTSGIDVNGSHTLSAGGQYGVATISTAVTGLTINNNTATNNSNTTGITLAAEGGSEARPESYVAFVCIKT